MILVDYSQVMIASIMKQLAFSDQEMDENLIRHMVLSSLRVYRREFSDYGEIVICADGANSWRKEYYPQYKASRKKSRAESPLDWNLIFDSLNKIRDEFRDNMPYPVLHFKHVEADDIIGSLCRCYGTQLNTSSEKIMIVSGDKDFGQLQKYANVEQYSPIQKQRIVQTNPEMFLKEHIMRGDTVDGIPNFLSPDDVFVSDGRQKPILKKKLDEWLTSDPLEFCTGDMMRNYMRNKKLIDLDEIPEYIYNKIVSTYEAYERNSRSKILNYFITKRLKNLTENISDF